MTNTTLWVSTNGLSLMSRLGYKPIAYLSYLTDEDGDTVSGFEMPLPDAEAAVALFIEHNQKPCNDCSFVKAYVNPEEK